MGNWRSGKTEWQRERLNKIKEKNIMRLKWLISLGLVVCLVMAFALPMCAPAPAPPVEEGEAPPVELDTYEKYVASLPGECFPVPRECFEQAQEEGEIVIWNWAEWFPDATYDNFAEEYGIKVTVVGFAGYAEMITKFRLNPKAEYDIVVPGPTPFAQLHGMGIWQEFNRDWLPNANEYQTQEYAKLFPDKWVDEGFHYGIPFDFGVTFYGYNSDYVDGSEFRTWGPLLEPDEKYRGRITMMDDMFDTIGPALEYLGYEWSSDNEDEIREAKELLIKQKPYVMAYASVPKREIQEEEVWIFETYTCDFFYAQHFGEGMPLVAVLPEEGSRTAAAGFTIPIGSPHPAAAHLWINYIFRPQVGAHLMEAIGALPASTAVGKYLPDDLSDYTAFITAYLPSCQLVQPKAYAVGSKGLELRIAAWEELKRA